VVVYEMLTGMKPFGAESLATLFYQVCKQDPPPPHELNTSLTKEVDGVIARALAKDPDARFLSCSDFVNALGTALSSSGGWQAAASTDAETRTITSVAAAVGVSEPGTFRRSIPNAHDDEEAIATEPVSERPPELEFPALPRRTRLNQAHGTELDEHTRPAWRNPAWLALIAGAIIALFVFFVARVSTREPSAPVAGRSAPGRSAPETSKATPPPVTETTRSTPAEQRAGEPTVKQREPEPIRNVPGENAAVSSPVPTAVSITTQPPGAKVTIDNRAESPCQSPCNTVLAPGRHTLTAELKGFDTARRIFTVPDERQLTVIMAQSMGVLLVTTEPSGSTVTVDGKQYGATPLTLRLPTGSHQLVVVNGTGRHEENVQIENDQFTTRSFRWQ